ncbi:Response regulator containing a CheY-like receiver domain and an HD-GYP domain [Alteromonadaceae bacterium Bs31]|nr:Response regulator containing a CheY-like receiver domain and an HD-GYP domain [Alteromonadaceae bacterium Bs31]
MKKLNLFRRKPAAKTHNILLKSWNILIVDDEHLVHEVTQMVLAGLQFEGSPLKLFSAYNGAEARKLMETQGPFALALIDVVMESDHAGLELVEWMRLNRQNHSTRIILRTGQAGIAPEEEVIRNYDINDYKNKTELTSTKLTTSVLSAIRSYRDILTIEKSREGLKRVIQASSEILKPGRLNEFGSAVLEQLLTLLSIEASSIYISNQEINIYSETSHTVLAATGDFSGYTGSLEEAQLAPPIKALIQKSFKKRKTIIEEDHFLGYYETDTNNSSVLYVQLPQQLEPFKSNLLEIFCSQVALAFENLRVKEEVLEVQSELLMIIGDAIEMRSKETGFHVRRVSELSRLLATKAGKSIAFQDYIAFASPLHDLGKIGIPETILEKPGTLDINEWNIMKKHSDIGGDLLQRCKRTVGKMGERIARYHHENWDGSGYPEGLKGEEIPIEARIAAVADVFDALASERSYKKAWPLSDIVDYFESQSSIKFDPSLVTLLLSNLEEFVDLRKSIHKQENMR